MAAVGVLISCPIRLVDGQQLPLDRGSIRRYADGRSAANLTTYQNGLPFIQTAMSIDGMLHQLPAEGTALEDLCRTSAQSFLRGSWEKTCSI